MEKLVEKRCYCCGNIKPIAEFNKNKSKPSGHCDECKECKKLLDLTYRRSEVGLIVSIYSTQKHISKKKEDIPHLITQKHNLPLLCIPIDIKSFIMLGESLDIYTT